jgi:hypothetical protein
MPQQEPSDLPGLDSHLEALLHEHAPAAARCIVRCARNLASFEVTPVRGARGRFTVPEMLDEHGRVVVVGARGSGKSAIASHVAHRCAEGCHRGTGRLPLVVPVELLAPGERLDEATLARTSPAAGRENVTHALAGKRALIIVDGLDRAPGGPSALLDSIAAFARAHEGNRILVTTRPLRTGIPGFLRAEIPGFVTAAVLPPLADVCVPSYRFLGMRSPARRAALYLEHVDGLLAAWDPGVDVALRDKRELFADIAFRMHDAGSFEIAGSALVAHVDRRGLPGAALLGEVRRQPGLLYERRPGRFAFAEFALQEVLAAVRLQHLVFPEMLVARRDDRFWHGVIELASGLAGTDATVLVQALMDAGGRHRPGVTLLAARCAEAAPALPDKLRRTIARYLADIVPPDSLAVAERLVEVGDVAAPAVLRALPGTGPVVRALSALVLGRLQYEPAAGVLVTLASDPAEVDATVVWPAGNVEVVLGGQPVAMSALVGLYDLALVSRVGRRAFSKALLRAPKPAVKLLLNDLVGDPLHLEGVPEPERDPDLIAALLAQMRSALAARRG